MVRISSVRFLKEKKFKLELSRVSLFRFKVIVIVSVFFRRRIFIIEWVFREIKDEVE